MPTDPLMTDAQLPDAPARPARQRRLRDIDFTRPTKFTPDQERRLERAYKSFCRGASTRMSAELRSTFSVELVETVQLTWANALDALPARQVSGVVEVAPIDGRMLLSIELTLVLGLLEPVLGGQADQQPPERWLTDVDRALARRTFQTLLDELSISFTDLAELQFRLLDLETERAPTQLAPLSEPTLAMTFDCKLGDTASTMMLLIPHRAVEPVLRSAGGTQHDADVAADAAVAVGAAMSDVVVELRAEVGSVDMSLRRVLALCPGDILRLDGTAEEGAVTLYADTVALQRAKLGRNGRRRAVGIMGPVEDDDR